MIFNDLKIQLAKADKQTDLLIQSDSDQRLNDILTSFNMLNLSALNINELLQVAQLVKMILLKYGGKSLCINLLCNITEDDMQYNKNFIYLSPFISLKQTSVHIDWGDGNIQDFQENAVIFHKYSSIGAYKIQIQSDDFVNILFYNVSNISLQQDFFDNSICLNSSTISSQSIVEYKVDENSEEKCIIDKNTISKNDIPSNCFNAYINENVVSIESHAFFNQPLRLITFGNSWKYTDNENMTIGQAAFANCTQLVGNIVLPDNCEEIGDDAFANCYNMFAITIPKSCNKIGKGAFYNCVNLDFMIFKDRSIDEINEFISKNSHLTEEGDASSYWFEHNEIDKLEVPSDSEYQKTISEFIHNLDIKKSFSKYYEFMVQVLERVNGKSLSNADFNDIKFLFNRTGEYIEQNKNSIVQSAILNNTKNRESWLNDDTNYRILFSASAPEGHQPCDQFICQSENDDACQIQIVTNTCPDPYTNCYPPCSDGDYASCEDLGKHTCEGDFAFVCHENICSNLPNGCSGNAQFVCLTKNECNSYAYNGCDYDNKFICKSADTCNGSEEHAYPPIGCGNDNSCNGDPYSGKPANFSCPWENGFVCNRKSQNTCVNKATKSCTKSNSCGKYGSNQCGTDAGHMCSTANSCANLAGNFCSKGSIFVCTAKNICTGAGLNGCIRGESTFECTYNNICIGESSDVCKNDEGNDNACLVYNSCFGNNSNHCTESSKKYCISDVICYGSASFVCSGESSKVRTNAMKASITQNDFNCIDKVASNYATSILESLYLTNVNIIIVSC